jgi:hypothetical protein
LGEFLSYNLNKRYEHYILLLLPFIDGAIFPLEEAALFPLLLGMKLSSESTLTYATLFSFAEAALFPFEEVVLFLLLLGMKSLSESTLVDATLFLFVDAALFPLVEAVLFPLVEAALFPLLLGMNIYHRRPRSHRTTGKASLYAPHLIFTIMYLFHPPEFQPQKFLPYFLGSPRRST